MEAALPTLLAALLLSGLCCAFRDVEAAAATPGDGQGYLQSGGSDATLFFCLTEAFGDQAAAKTVFPSGPLSQAYEAARTMAFKRALPAAVVYAADVSDVQKAVVCGVRAGYRISAAGRRHSYQGWSVVSGYLTVDLSNLTSIVVDKVGADSYVARAGAGNTNALLLAAVARAGVPGLLSLIGSCPSVGITGYALGGGQGDITPYVGLGADQVLGLKMVTWEGKVVDADATRNPDLLWAARGGGGGLGIITELTIKLHKAPDPNRFSRIHLDYRSSARLDATARFLDWLASGKADRRLGGGGAIVQGGSGLNFMFLGGWEEGLKLLREAGLVRPEWMDEARPAVLRVNYEARDAAKAGVLRGVTVHQVPEYGEFMAMQICKTYLDGVQFGDTAPDLAPLSSGGCDSRAGIEALLAHLAKPNSLLNVGTSLAWTSPTWATTGGRMVKRVSRACWQAMIDVVDDKTPYPGEIGALVTALKADRRAGVGLNHFAHGRVADVAPNATAYPWRDLPLLLTLDVGPPSPAVWQAAIAGANTSGCARVAAAASKVNPLWQANPVGINPVAETAKGTDLCIAKAMSKVALANSKWVEQLLAAFNSPACRDSTVHSAGYLNYLTADRPDWRTYYWGDNYARLARIKAAWDPHSRFSKPFTPEPAMGASAT